MDRITEACITESGRILDTSDFLATGAEIKELVNGAWIPARSPLFGEELYHARVLSDEELRMYVEKSGRSS